MTPEEFRERFEAFWERANAEAVASKSSQQAYEELRSLYARLDVDERLVADDILADWVLSNDDSRLWDALALIRDFNVKSALPALRKLEARLETSNAPGAPYDWAKVNRLIGHLLSEDGGQE
jgi:hypothetical protein